jgi:hypothetical protein
LGLNASQTRGPRTHHSLDHRNMFPEIWKIKNLCTTSATVRTMVKLFKGR